VTDAHASRKPWFSLVVDGSSAGLELLVGSFDVFCVWRAVRLIVSAMIQYFYLTTKRHQLAYKPQKRSSEQGAGC